MTILLERVRSKGHQMKKAYETNQDAYLAHCMAKKNHAAQNTDQTNHALVTTEMIWENTRDTLVTLARGLHDATQAFLAHADEGDFKIVRKQVSALQEAISLESIAFHAYSRDTTGDTKKRKAFEASQSAIISKAWPLVDGILSMDGGYDMTMIGYHASWYFEQEDCLKASAAAHTLALDEGTIETDLDGTPAWALATNDADRDRIIYENRKATLGAKAAGRMTYAEPRALAKRRAAGRAD